LEVAMKNVSENQFVERVRPYPANMLDKAQTLPGHADVWWMSQFLDCFSPIEILNILKKVKAQLTKG
ncbi:SAM-dependent methyltransferase, partial [Vibrio sp. OPT46]|nr:SAM-dependent methyltransferase [Vibrio sp. OPT46]